MREIWQAIKNQFKFRQKTYKIVITLSTAVQPPETKPQTISKTFDILKFIESLLYYNLIKMLLKVSCDKNLNSTGLMEK